MLQEENFKKLISKNLIYYRKVNNLTQIQLAEKLNYSDKAISKWERGESIPDIFVLSIIAEMFGITLNDLTSEKKKPIAVNKQKRRLIITLMSIGLVWLVATFVDIIMLIIDPSITKAWLAFIYAIPVSLIVLLVFAKIWSNNRLLLALNVSALCWSIPLTICLTSSFDRLWFLFICIIPLQILVILWFLFPRIKTDDIVNQEEKSE